MRNTTFFEQYVKELTRRLAPQRFFPKRFPLGQDRQLFSLNHQKKSHSKIKNLLCELIIYIIPVKQAFLCFIAPPEQPRRIQFLISLL